jgi:hypothetical protein
MPAYTVDSTIASFMAYLSRRGRAKRTRLKYSRYLRDFAEWAAERDPGGISAREIELEYLDGWDEQFTDRWGAPPAPHLERPGALSRAPIATLPAPG